MGSHCANRSCSPLNESYSIFHGRSHWGTSTYTACPPTVIPLWRSPPPAKSHPAFQDQLKCHRPPGPWLSPLTQYQCRPEPPRLLCNHQASLPSSHTLHRMLFQSPSPVWFLVIIQVSASIASPQRGPTLPPSPPPTPFHPYPCTCFCLSLTLRITYLQLWLACFSSAFDTKLQLLMGSDSICLICHHCQPCLTTWRTWVFHIYFLSE